MPGKIKCSFYWRACESESGIKEEEKLQTFDSLMQSERVLMIKEMWLFSVSIHLHLVFSLWLTLSCIFIENLVFITFPFTLLWVCVSTFRGSICCFWQTYHCLSYHILLVLFRIHSLYICSFLLFSLCSKELNTIFFPSLCPFVFFLISLTSTWSEFYAVLCHRWASLVSRW